MTEGRAREVLQEQIDKYGQEYDAEGIEALEMAIKALEQESITWIVGKDNCQVAVRNMPIDKMQKICAIIGEEEQQPCEDCVSRQEFEKRIKPYDTDDKMDKALYNFAHNILISCTSVKPQRPKGRWIGIKYDGYADGNPVYDVFECSNCKIEHYGEDDTLTSFCPYCGAEMDGGESNDD